MKHRFMKILAVIAILAICLIPTTAGVQAAPARVQTTNIQYVVQPGDTLGSIAYEYCTTWQAIYDLNSAVIGPDPNVIYPGMVLTIPANCQPGTTPPPSSGVYDHGPRTGATGTFLAPYYTVAWGDYLSAIGVRFGLPYQEIMTANNLTSEVIYPEQVLYIPGTTTTPPPPLPGPAERVYFSNGAVSASLTGTISNGVPKTYVLTVLGGQMMQVYGSSHGEPLTVSIVNSAGQPVAVTGANGQVNFNVSAVMPATDDYFVTFTPVTMPESPSLAFDVTFYIPPK